MLYVFARYIIKYQSNGKYGYITRNIERNSIKQIDEKTIDVHIRVICDIVFDFEIFDSIPYTSELLCDDMVIHKNVDNIKYTPSLHNADLFHNDYTLSS